MPVTDPGEQFPYLDVSHHQGDFKVLKTCRVQVYDAFWASEPISEEEKPSRILIPDEVPEELWDMLTDNERLESYLAGERRKLAILQKKMGRWQSATAVLALTLLLTLIMLRPEWFK